MCSFFFFFLFLRAGETDIRSHSCRGTGGVDARAPRSHCCKYARAHFIFPRANHSQLSPSFLENLTLCFAVLSQDIMMCYMVQAGERMPEPCLAPDLSETVSQCIESLNGAQYAVFSTFLQHIRGTDHQLQRVIGEEGESDQQQPSEHISTLSYGESKRKYSW